MCLHVVRIHNWLTNVWLQYLDFTTTRMRLRPHPRSPCNNRRSCVLLYHSVPFLYEFGRLKIYKCTNLRCLYVGGGEDVFMRRYVINYWYNWERLLALSFVELCSLFKLYMYYVQNHAVASMHSSAPTRSRTLRLFTLAHCCGSHTRLFPDIRNNKILTKVWQSVQRKR